MPALEREPCLVSFSGGRDSSTVLAAAVAVARRDGFDLPIPITIRFRDAPRAEEAEWQERVVAHLGVVDWIRLEVADDLDLVGQVATRVLRDHGLLYPFNLFFHEPLVARAAGGSLLTGCGGDETLAEWRWRKLADALAGRRAFNRWDVLDATYLLLPRALRARVDRRYVERPPHWLRPHASSAALTSMVEAGVDEPFAWSTWLWWSASRRGLTALRWGLDLLARAADARVHHPLIAPGVLAALGRLGGRLGLGDRTSIMECAFGELLPPDVVRRPGKAWFSEVFWRRHSRDLVREWDGEGVDEDLVDPAALRREWEKREPDARSFLLLQSVWLAHSVDTLTKVPDRGSGP